MVGNGFTNYHRRGAVIRLIMRLLYLLLSIVLIGLLGATIHYLWLTLYPYPMVDIQAVEIINGLEYERGEQIVFKVTYVKERNYPSETHRRIECEDGNLVTMTSFNTSLPLADSPTVVLSPPMTIPEKVSDGWCWFVFTEHTFVNDVRTEIYEDRSDPFFVLPKESNN